MNENIFGEIGIGIAQLVSHASPSSLTINLQKTDTPFCKKGYRLEMKKDGHSVSAKAESLVDAINLLIVKLEDYNV